MKRRFIQNTLIIVLGISIIAMSISYVAFGAGFELTYAKPSDSLYWDIHFENTYTTSNTTIEDSEHITPAAINSNTTALKFGIIIKPGEVYELTTTLRNGGTYNGMLSDIALLVNGNDVLLDNDNKYINCIVSYDDGTKINKGDIINAGYKRNIIVRIEYMEVEGAKLPEENFTFNLNMNYNQV